MQSFVFVIISALAHALWNVLLKKSNDKYAFNFMMHAVNITFFTILAATLLSQRFTLDIAAIGYGFLAACFFTGYHLFLSTSYRYGDISLVYPVTTSAPLFIALWAFVLLDETLTVAGLAGIVLTVAGTVVINTTSGVKLGLGSGVGYALAAALMYSFGALVDKLGVDTTGFFVYVYTMTLFMTGFIYLFTRSRSIAILPHIRTQWKLALPAGLILFVSFITYRLGLAGMEVAYAAALRQVSAFFGVLVGIAAFGERYGKRRMLGTAIIISGVVLIRLSMG